MVDLDFKINPVFIPSAAITKLELYPHSAGGFSDTWKCAMSTELGTSKVAVKSFRTSQMDEQELRRISRSIRREAYVWITLKHDHILLFEGVTDGFGKLPALVSLWMEHGTLSNYLNKEFSTLSDHRKLQLVHQVADGLAYLHGNDIVHGDLTGTNILVDGSGNVRIADFALSVIVAEAANLTFDSVHRGNLRWMAPEFLDPESSPMLTKQGDIYSFGCVMLQILSGQEPYSRIKGMIRVFSAIIGGWGPFHGVAISMSDGCERLSSQCLSRIPEGRPTIIQIIDIIDPGHRYKPTPNVEPEEPELDIVLLPDLTKFISKTGDYPVAGGGFGDIWKCIYETVGGQIDVAVKSLRVYVSYTDSEMMKKKSRSIRREINTCARIKHRNIMPVYGYTTGFGLFMAIVAPWAENGNLSTYLTREDACLSVTRRFEILRDVADGLQYLHTQKVIHGDLTGPNVLIRGDGIACLADFGLSLRYSDNVSISQADWTTKFHGSFPWLAPELLEQREDDLPVRPSKSSDIYAFGGIMLQVLTSKIPYYYLKEFVIISSITQGKKPDRSRYPAFSDKYWYIIEECWSTVPETRPSTQKVFKVIGDELESLSSSSADY